ncbi:unnamed protein product [Vitrella brassicaformis CCMP3155]|uniref:Uncharacterized protein n=1 Tax=Vitrella brassicaformis (strain CCMP3155) TaxID=1169540 RepID=A0A0G4EW67_VITBC|nr:unnamed protein product [Vitrella brassicaformis CCMP3155]|eukprot:CEM02488.1 unnamed protein product [Vitrella brassicaformis CCMP3155]
MAGTTGTSFRLIHQSRVFDVPSTVDQKAEVLKQVPVAAEEGQPGPLANLEDIGPMEVSSYLMLDQQGFTVWCTRLQELGSVLEARGCRRSLKSLKVKFVDETVVVPRLFQFAEALQTFVIAVCIGDAPISFTSAAPRFHLDLSLLHSPLFPSAPSPVLETLMRQLADQARQVTVDTRSADLATPPTPAMLDMARDLAFNKATSVHVFGVDQPAQAAPAPAHPDLAIIDRIQLMPQPSQLVLDKHTALAAGTQLASKMPNLRELYIDNTTEERAAEAITAIGCEREPDVVAVSDIREVGSGAIDIGEHREGFPQINEVVVVLIGGSWWRHRPCQVRLFEHEVAAAAQLRDGGPPDGPAGQNTYQFEHQTGQPGGQSDVTILGEGCDRPRRSGGRCMQSCGAD